VRGKVAVVDVPLRVAADILELHLAVISGHLHAAVQPIRGHVAMPRRHRGERRRRQFQR